MSGIRLNYIEKGEGFPLILLHGNGENCEYFCRQIEYFSRDFRVIAVDTRGHGKSPRGGGEFTLSRFADDLYDFMKEHGIEKADILGFSDGANIAMYFAMRYPYSVRRLVLNGGNISPSGVKGYFQIFVELWYKIASHFAKGSEKAARNAEMLGLMVNGPHISPSELGEISAPTLVIAGTHDLIKQKHTELIAASIPNAALKFIKGGHSIAAQKYKQYNKAVGKFLKGDL